LPAPCSASRNVSSAVSSLLPPPLPSPISPLHRPLSAAAPPVSPSPSFAVEEYLVDTCGLTRVHALKASAKISHLKSPSNPDAVLAFLADLGLAPADIAAVVAKDPKLLCAGVERTLGPVVVGLTGLGISRSEIVRLVSVAGGRFRCKSIIAKMQYYLNLFGSTENLLRALQLNSYLLEFLTHETTCASEMLEKTTCEIFCQKRPPMSGGTLGQATQRRHPGMR
jgi:mTERF domain-containing protein